MICSGLSYDPLQEHDEEGGEEEEVSHRYDPILPPVLPAPPQPRGNTTSDYLESLNVRDKEMRKSEEALTVYSVYMYLIVTINIVHTQFSDLKKS